MSREGESSHVAELGRVTETSDQEGLEFRNGRADILSRKGSSFIMLGINFHHRARLEVRHGRA